MTKNTPSDKKQTQNVRRVGGHSPVCAQESIFSSTKKRLTQTYCSYEVKQIIRSQRWRDEEKITSSLENLVCCGVQHCGLLCSTAYFWFLSYPGILEERCTKKVNWFRRNRDVRLRIAFLSCAGKYSLTGSNIESDIPQIPLWYYLYSTDTACFSGANLK